MIIYTRLHTTKEDFFGMARKAYELLGQAEIEELELDSIFESKLSVDYGYQTPLQCMADALYGKAETMGLKVERDYSVYRQDYEFEKSWLGEEPTFLHNLPF